MSRRPSLVPVLASVVTLAFAFAIAPRVVAQSAATAPHHDMGAMDPAAMSDAAMQRMADAWFARHPATPSTRAAATAVAADTFFASGFVFDNGSPATIDTAYIHAGDTILWQWVGGSHTVTNGTGSGDPAMGTLFNANLNSVVATQQFSYTFQTPGTYPFFCVFHELQNMKGVVVVQSLVGVTPGAARVAGFVGDPVPVPSRGGVSFRFTLAAPGRARAEVFDVRGRRVAVALDRVSGAGTFDGTWDGRVSGGARAASGVYYLRLTAPGVDQSRRIVIAD